MPQLMPKVLPRTKPAAFLPSPTVYENWPNGLPLIPVHTVIYQFFLSKDPQFSLTLFNIFFISL
ncbi:MAG: hypothetical protein K6U80_17900, partial [Firmicutes bacterium]|nr:hypothetical protein [Bacillota bacterium]